MGSILTYNSGWVFQLSSTPSSLKSATNRRKSKQKTNFPHLHATFLSRPPYMNTLVLNTIEKTRFSENVQRIFIRFLQENENNLSLNYFPYCTRHRFQIKGIVQSVFFTKNVDFRSHTTSPVQYFSVYYYSIHRPFSFLTPKYFPR